MTREQKYSEAQKRFTKAYLDAAESAKELASAFGRLIMTAYKDAGEPYGQTDEGMMQWWQEQPEYRES